jgi:glyoxylase-like metal-dependent hydrolase (beta-lactamase superfamily II)
MPRWLRNLSIALASAVLFAVAGWSWAMGREDVPETSSYRLDLAELRLLANSIPGDKPIAVNSEFVAKATIPLAGVFAGEAFTPHPMFHHAYQLQFSDRYFVIDSGFDKATHSQMAADQPFSEAGWGAVQRGLEGAQGIFITHEHSDHLAGIAQHARPELLRPRLRLTSEQLANTQRLDQVSMPAALRSVPALEYDRVLALAPGFVAQKAAGHTPGSQIFFVQLADGRELLLIGDVAWHLDALRQLHYRPRLVTNLLLNEDREAVLNQFRALHDLMQAEPDLWIVPSHDGQLRDAMIAAGVLGEGWLLPPGEP